MSDFLRLTYIRVQIRVCVMVSIVGLFTCFRPLSHRTPSRGKEGLPGTYRWLSYCRSETVDWRGTSKPDSCEFSDCSQVPWRFKPNYWARNSLLIQFACIQYWSVPVCLLSSLVLFFARIRNHHLFRLSHIIQILFLFKIPVGPSHSFAPNFHFQFDCKDSCLWRHGVGFLVVAGFRETSCRRTSLQCETGLEDSSFASVRSDDTRPVTLPTKRITGRKSVRLFQCAMNGEWNVQARSQN